MILPRWFFMGALAAAACSQSHGGHGDPEDGGDLTRRSADAGHPVADAAVRDAGSRDSGIRDATVSDAGVRMLSCDRMMDIAVDPCVDVECGPGSPPLFFWNGVECAPFPACVGCIGEDCNRLMSEGDCRAAFGSCAPILCEETGGDWYAELAYCGHHVCGHPGPEICDEPTPSCNCGIGRVFDEERGCIESAACDVEDLCEATAGDWTIGCGVDGCGNPITVCAAPFRFCDCGGGLVFHPERGCEGSLLDECAGPTAEALCERTDGGWYDGLCVPSYCGYGSNLGCTGFACDCGQYRVFDPLFGCRRSSECNVLGHFGDPCLDDGMGHSCSPELVCCYGGAFISSGHCETPQCDPYGPCGPPRP